MTEHFFETTAGIKIPIEPISLLDLQLVQNAIEQEFKDKGKPIEPPTYEVRLELEDTSEYHPHTEVTIKEATDEEKEAWQKHLEAVNEMQDEIQNRTALIFLEGIIFDLPEDDKWIKRRKRLFNEDVPEDEDEKKLHYINNILLKTPADKNNLMLEIQKLSMTGADEEAIEAFEELFRSQMEIQGRQATKELKARLEKQKDLVLQPATEGRTGSEGTETNDKPISTTADSGPDRNNSSGENIIKDVGVGTVPRSTGKRQGKKQAS